MASESVITTRALAKSYGDVRAVDGIGLDVRRGEIYAFLGRNGAGKTTTIRMSLGLVRPSGGEVSIFGKPLQPSGPALARVGYLVETAVAYPNLTVLENLDIQRRLTGAPASAVATAVELLSLDEYTDRRSAALSLGNKQRLALARALLHSPELLILDEPANGLDPAGIIEVRELLRRLADDTGVTVFMSSHILAEVAHLADRIGIIHAGRMVEELDRAGLHARKRAWLEVGASDAGRAREVLADRLGMTDVEADGDLGLRVPGSADRAAEVSRTIVEAGIELTRLQPAEEDLEAYFMRLTGGDE